MTATAITWAIPAVLLVSATGVLYQLCRTPRASRRPQPGQQIWDAAAHKWVAAQPAAEKQDDADLRPGTDAAALDWLELTYGMDAYDGPGWTPGRNRFQPPGLSEAELDATEARLQGAIDEQQEGEQP